MPRPKIDRSGPLHVWSTVGLRFRESGWCPTIASRYSTDVRSPGCISIDPFPGAIPSRCGAGWPRQPVVSAPTAGRAPSSAPPPDGRKPSLMRRRRVVGLAGAGMGVRPDEFSETRVTRSVVIMIVLLDPLVQISRVEGAGGIEPFIATAPLGAPGGWPPPNCRRTSGGCRRPFYRLDEGDANTADPFGPKAPAGIGMFRIRHGPSSRSHVVRRLRSGASVIGPEGNGSCAGEDVPTASRWTVSGLTLGRSQDRKVLGETPDDPRCCSLLAEAGGQAQVERTLGRWERDEPCETSHEPGIR